MAILIGAVLAFAIGLFATGVGLDRDRALYPVVMIVIALYYVLFAVMGGSGETLILESLAGAIFVAMAVLGFRRSLWLVAFALAAHGVFDLVHGAVITNPGVPEWWPGFCLAYDVAAAGYLAMRILRGRIRAADPGFGAGSG